jgi:hypothetical protein
MRPSQQKVIDELNAALKSFQAARDSIPVTIANYDAIIARHDELKLQMEELRDDYGRTVEMTPDEIILFNFQQAIRMVKAGMAAETVSAVFAKEGIQMPIELIKEIVKPGAIAGLLGGLKKE